MINQENKKKVFVKTYGCQMNEYDSEKMLMLLSDNFDRVESYESADLILVNTCSVREKGEHKLFGLLGKLRELKSEKPDLVIGVGGCVAQQEGENIIKRNSAVDFVIGTHNISLLPSMVKASQDNLGKQVAVDYREDWDELPDEFDALPDDTKIIASAFNSKVRALVAIQRGCDKKCAFCVVPTTRGPQVSRAEEEIIKEIKLKVRMGAREVMLLGQTVNSYGVDLKERKKFSDLVKKISEIEGVKRIRFTSPHPAEVKTDFIKLYSEIPQLCPHIHMPLQSGSNKILKAMNRNYKKERFLEIINEVRQVSPNISITTDIIVGFPGETEEDYLETIDLMKQVKFSQAFSFKYSIRPNTKAKEIYSKDQEVPEDVKTRRLCDLQALQEEHTLEFNKKFENQITSILVESVDKTKNTFKGRSDHNIYTDVFAENAKLPSLGDVIDVKVVRSTPHGFHANKIATIQY